MKNNKELLVVDVESTCWKNNDLRPKNEISEIIEVGITSVNLDKLSVIKTESILIRPKFSKVSDFCTELTTLTQDMLDRDGITYKQACDKLEREYKSYNKTMISWGDYDRNMFENNCKLHYCKYPFGRHHLNLKMLFAILHKLPNELGMDEALKYLNIPLEGTHHRGCDDSLNIAKILIKTLGSFNI